MKVFDQVSWLLIFLSILFVSIIFFITARIGTRNFGIRTFAEEIILSPFRYKLDQQINQVKVCSSEEQSANVPCVYK